MLKSLLMGRSLQRRGGRGVEMGGGACAAHAGATRKRPLSRRGEGGRAGKGGPLWSPVSRAYQRSPE